MAKPGATGITRIIHATNYSMKGLSSAWRHEAAFRQELLLIVLLMPLAFFVGDSLNQILLLMVISWLVVIVEILNSAIVSTHQQPSEACRFSLPCLPTFHSPSP